MHHKCIQTSLLFEQFNNNICMQIFNDVYKEFTTETKDKHTLNRYDEFANVLSYQLIEESLTKYDQWLKVKQKLYPLAAHLSYDICWSIYRLIDYASFLSKNILLEAVTTYVDKSNSSKSNMDLFADEIMSKILLSSKSSLQNALKNGTQFKSDNLANTMTMREKLDKWASTFASKLVSNSREDLRSISSCHDDDVSSLKSWGSHSSKHKIYRNINSNNSNNKSNNNRRDLNDYAQHLINQILVRRKSLPNASTTTGNISSELSCCESCDSLISNELMSMHSGDTSDRGLHYFADKLLYSLSNLEDSLLEALNVGNCEPEVYRSTRVVWTGRRSSAPELRSSIRRPSLRTVPEGGDIMEITSEDNFDQPPTKNGLISSYSYALSNIIICQGIQLAIQ